jgi:hypothetical protein
MKEWILVLRLLGQDIETGEIDWHEAFRVSDISFQVCVEELVTILNTLEEKQIQHEIYCTTAEREANAAAKETEDK